jgi:hypothetical protein
MHRWLAMLLAGAGLHGAAIRGSVVSYEGGEPLSQAQVVLRAVAGSGGATRTARTDSSGVFVFSTVSAGTYLVSASRQYSVPAYYGQKRWDSAGLPVTVEANDSPMLTIRMHRWGAIAGRVVDENDVGIPGQDVVAYRDAKALQAIGRATTDDYGRYRIYGLTPGTYLVRSGAKEVDGVSYLPAFAPSSPEMDQARRVDVQLDQDATGIDVSPAQGRLFEVQGRVSGDAPVELTLAGETGRQTISVSGSFRFNPVAPGQYELYGTTPSPANCRASGLAGAYMKLAVDRDMTGLAVALSCVEPTRISYSMPPAKGPSRGLGNLRARRVDLAGIGDAINLGVGAATAVLAPGQWEMLLQPPAGYSVSGFYLQAGAASGFGIRPDGWLAFTAGGYGNVYFSLSENPSSLRGVVTGTDPQNAKGVPVYVEGYDPGTKIRIGELRTVYTNARGAYNCSGLAPGAYRVLATFEYLAPDSATMEISGAKTVTVWGSDPQTLDVDLFVIP